MTQNELNNPKKGLVNKKKETKIPVVVNKGKKGLTELQEKNIREKVIIVNYMTEFCKENDITEKELEKEVCSSESTLRRFWCSTWLGRGAVSKWSTIFDFSQAVSSHEIYAAKLLMALCSLIKFMFQNNIISIHCTSVGKNKVRIDIEFKHHIKTYKKGDKSPEDDETRELF